jgi:hypothetical protein
MILSNQPANGPSVAVRPHWRSALAATVHSHLSQFWFREKWDRCLKFSIVMSVTAALGGHTLFCPRVAQAKERPMSYEQKSSRRDHLTSTTKDGKIELTEGQLSRVVGGGVHFKYQAPLKVSTETVYL